MRPAEIFFPDDSLIGKVADVLDIHIARRRKACFNVFRARFLVDITQRVPDPNYGGRVIVRVISGSRFRDSKRKSGKLKILFKLATCLKGRYPASSPPVVVQLHTRAISQWLVVSLWSFFLSGFTRQRKDAWCGEAQYFVVWGEVFENRTTIAGLGAPTTDDCETP